MLNNKKSPIRKLAKHLSVLSLALLLITANSVYAQTNETQRDAVVKEYVPPPQEPVNKESKKDKVYTVVDKQPEFPGGTTGLKNWLGTNIQYPLNLHGKKIKGSVIVNFIVEKDGTVSNVKVDRGIDLLLMKEATRVVSLMPKWKPGELNNEAVRVKYTLPVDFLFSKEDYYIECLNHNPEKEEDKGKTLKLQHEKATNILNERGSVINQLVIIDSVKMEKGFDVNKLNRDDIASSRIYKGEDEIDFITSIDKKAEFPGGFEAFINYLNDNVRYPNGALKDAIEGNVFTSFDVNKDGSISDIAIVRSLHPLLDEEAIRVLIDMPNWNPAIKDGKPIKMKVIWPVDFSLNYLDRYKY